jgi:hypothetical protein
LDFIHRVGFSLPTATNQVPTTDDSTRLPSYNIIFNHTIFIDGTLTMIALSQFSRRAFSASSQASSLVWADRQEPYRQSRLTLSVFSDRSLDQRLVGKPLASRAGYETIKPVQGMTLHVPFVEAEGELVNVAVQMLLAGVVINADQPTLTNCETLSIPFVVTPSRANSPSLWLTVSWSKNMPPIPA